VALITYKFVAPTPRWQTKGGGKLITVGVAVPMTPRQRDVYLYVRYYWEKWGYAPSYMDIASGLGLSSKGGVHKIVKRLMELGLLERERYRPRDIKPKGVSIHRLVRKFT
jgi:Mn-dependent DtxR family transcriptional regulator